MNIINLQISKIIIHQIFQRDGDGNKVTPKPSSEFINFDTEAMETFKSRVINALGNDSKAVPMTIINQARTDLATIVDQLPTATEKDFIELSYDIANKLADAQKRKSLPGGIVVVFAGRYGATPKNFVGIMKAEIHSAYEKLLNEATQEITLKYVEEALLTPATKLYKTAGFFCNSNNNHSQNLNEKWNVLVCDSQISHTDGKAAAQYFYADFLGCGYPESSARTTKQFYDATCEFIKDLDISSEERNDLHNTLVSYLKYENTDVINPAEFSERYFTEDVRDSYSDFLDDKEIPSTSFTKDIEHISSKLKMRRLSFSKNVKLSAPSDIFEKLITIETIKESEEGKAVNWTKIIVKDTIVSQE